MTFGLDYYADLAYATGLTRDEVKRVVTAINYLGMKVPVPMGAVGMMNLSLLVSEAKRLYGHPVRVMPTVEELSNEELDFLADLITEEYEEVCGAFDARDKVKLTQELADLMYVVVGAACGMGLPLGTAFQAIHEANMRKVQPDGTLKYRADGKVLKPDGWKPADIAGIVAQYEKIVEVLGGSVGATSKEVDPNAWAFKNGLEST